jgi:hypothetical protein
MDKWKLVPVEPPEKMKVALSQAAREFVHNPEYGLLAVYDTLLAAAPDPPPSRDVVAEVELKDAEIERLEKRVMKAEIEAMKNEAQLRADNERLTSILYHNGFRSCDIAECNCGSWHQIGGFAARFREIEDATADEWRNGETLLTRIERIMLDLQALRGEGK